MEEDTLIHGIKTDRAVALIRVLQLGHLNLEIQVVDVAGIQLGTRGGTGGHVGVLVLSPDGLPLLLCVVLDTVVDRPGLARNPQRRVVGRDTVLTSRGQQDDVVGRDGDEGLGGLAFAVFGVVVLLEVEGQHRGWQLGLQAGDLREDVQRGQER